MGWLFGEDNPVAVSKHYIVDNGEYFAITQSYADMGEREGWLVLIGFKCNALGIWTNTYRHV